MVCGKCSDDFSGKQMQNLCKIIQIDVGFTDRGIKCGAKDIK